jgi:peroxiredoxin family protein
MSDNKKATIVVFSGDMDKVMAALIIATGAAAAGMETTREAANSEITLFV